MPLKHHNPFRVCWRMFRIWQKTGEVPFKRQGDSLPPIRCNSCGKTFDTPFCPNCGQSYKASSNLFFKGSFDNIPFLNDDAKRTFVHLLFRPGYMIMDYLKGKNSRYLAPMTALIIFYAFYALASAVLSPNLPGGEMKDKSFLEGTSGTINISDESAKIDSVDVSRFMKLIRDAYLLTCYDLHPEYVDTPVKASIAAFTAALRSQGIYMFIGRLIFLTLSMWMVFGWRRKKKRRLGFSASATVASYVLCQYCFFMLIMLFCTLGKHTEVGWFLMPALLLVDFHQLFDFGFWKGVRKVIAIYFSGLAFIIILASLAVTFLAFKYGVTSL